MGNDGKHSDLIVIDTGVAGLVAACEALDAGMRVTLLDQVNENNLGGQAHWSFGGLFLVDSPEQRRLRVKDSFDLAWSDWLGSAQFDRLDDEDYWAARWARACVEFAAGEKRDWIRAQGIELTPVVGWAERGDGRADGDGNSVPRFHVAWGTGTGISNPFWPRCVQQWVNQKKTSHEPVFERTNWLPVSHRADWQVWKDFLAGAGVSDGRAHDSRHTVATTLLLLGVE